MSEQRYTPGPWKVIRPGHGHPSEYMCVQYGADDRYTSLEMLPADARLTAAAPDLFEAANAVLNHFMPQFPDSRAVDDCLVQLAAAVAKAEKKR